ncbi:hypothetical protein NADFUDRAFT_46380 [Nadsonia fulvescens var. elongata DSM 6958]|uniref:RING-type E3 ubiquitin transferase n=1 Tax=Nadsonia fulvescens var. elongata DSM 6958 TaxID=857566 RepID=A0A1E3PLB3_9ASCO|nr:hypothetical protein NADFUDRAFT_46380 [Nadsonia fulvescens var. elongata DSM 6958]
MTDPIDSSSITTATTASSLKRSSESLKTPPTSMTIEDWENNALERVLAVTINNDKKDVLLYLENVRTDIQESHTDLLPRLSLDYLDNALFTRLSEHPCDPNPFTYLLNCWNRATEAKRLLRKSESNYEHKFKVYSDSSLLCSRYAMLCITMPGLFGSQNETEDVVNIVELMVFQVDSSRHFPWKFVQEIIQKAIDDESLLSLVEPIMKHISTKMKSMKGMSNYRPYLVLLEKLVEDKQVAAILPKIDSFNADNLNAINIEFDSLLGPFLRISPLNYDSAAVFFDAGSTDRNQPHNASACVLELRTLQNQLFYIVNKIIRASPESRVALLNYFSKAININTKRRATQIFPGSVSGDGFMTNVTLILIKLAEPFIDPSCTKITKVDPDYFCKTDLINIDEETKISSDLAESKKYYQENTSTEGETPNFISDVFFLTVAYMHYGLGGTIQSLTRLKKTVEELKSNLDRLEAEIPKWAHTNQASRLTQMIERVRNQLSQSRVLVMALEAILYDSKMNESVLSFVMFLSTWLIRIAEPNHQHPQTLVKLPITVPSPAGFKNLPEYMIDVCADYWKMLSKQCPQVLVSYHHLTPMLQFSVVFLRTAEYINNPYLKSKLTEVLFYGSLELGNGASGYLVDLFNSDPLTLKHLFHAMMNFYIEIERTGGSNQFYDKFNYRYFASQIFKCLWNSPTYRKQLERESKENIEFFVKFVALMLNDATFLLDESLAKLVEIHNLQTDPVAVFNDNTENQEPPSAENIQTRLRSAEQQASSWLQLGNQTVKLLELFTSAVPRAFVTPEIVDRLAGMLNYNLEALVGPKCRDLKVENPEKYGFDPKALLSLICDVYLNLSTLEEFVQATARDGRSFRLSTFERAIEILNKFKFKSDRALNQLATFAQSAESMRLQNLEQDLELGDIPDEFLDPLMYTLMENPVILPSSKVSIDMSTIKQHLLSDEKDPFNRAPLNIEDVVPDVELKERIRQFKLERRAASMQN